MPTETTGSDVKTSAPSLLPPAAALLRELLESSRNLPNSSRDNGSIQLGLKEIRKRARKLREGANDENDTKAHYLLAGSGVNAENIAMDLQSLNFQHSLEPALLASNEVDIDDYLEARKEETILSAIEESARSTAREFDLFLAHNISIDWKQRKQTICEHFGLVPKAQTDVAGDTIRDSSSTAPGANKSLTRSRAWGNYSEGRYVLGSTTGEGKFSDVETVSQVGIGTIAARQSILAVQSRTKKHAQVVERLNAARLNHAQFHIAKEFADVTASYGQDTRSQQLHDAWRILMSISGETLDRTVQERKYSRQYTAVATQPTSTQAIELNTRIASGSKAFLERQFFEVIESEIAKNPQDAQLGGIPSVFNKIRAFLNLKFAKNGRWVRTNLEMVNNVPIWALVYYMLRSGHSKDALDYVLKSEKAFQKVDRSFAQYLKAYVTTPDARLPWELLERLHTEFNQRVRFLHAEDDPYKYALYKIIGRCELSRKVFPEVVVTTEDWLWVQLALTRESEGDLNPVYERYGLRDLQRLIIHFGAKHFNPNKTNPGLYFQVLLFAGLFEWAIHYLYSFSPVDAVHFAIALTYYGLLRPVDDVVKADSELLVLDRAEFPHLNFARLIGVYTNDFRRSDPGVAVDYLVLICLNGDLAAGKTHLHLCHEALKELVLETREFSTLLGDVMADGTRQRGAIETRMKLIHIDDERQYLHTITEQAAHKASEDGRTADSILLFQLSEEYDTVVSIINQSLGETLSVVELGSPLSSLPEGASLMMTATGDPAQLARNMMTVYSNNPAVLARVSVRNRETCNALLTLVDAREAYAHGRYEEALTFVDKTGILSLSPSSSVGDVRRRAQQFTALHDSIARNVPVLLVMVMECFVKLSQVLKQSEYSNNSRTAKIADLRASARNSMVYAGMIQYRMPREVYSRLTALESYM